VAGQGAYGWRWRLSALGAILVLGCALIAPGIGAGVALAAAGKAGGSAPAPTTPAQTAPAEGANGNAFSELSQGGGEQEATAKSTAEKTTSESSTKNSKKTVIVIVIAALALLVAIAYVIVRDARKNAPATDPQVVEARSAHDAAATLRKRRAKARAARQARKRNR